MSQLRTRAPEAERSIPRSSRFGASRWLIAGGYRRRKSVAGLILTVLTTCGLAHPNQPPQFPGSLKRDLNAGLSARIDQARHTLEGSAPDRGVVALDQAEKDLGNPFVVACVAARPGDEDSAALVYCRKKLGAQTVAAFATRGEQSEDQARSAEHESLAVVRTCQALEVARDEGADVYFLDLPDQQAGQPADEMTSAWDKKDGLLSMVRFIRTVHPDVLISGGGFGSGDEADLAVQRLAARGVDSAADPAQFPEAGSAWSVKRLYMRAAQDNRDATINAGQLDPVRGQTYVRMAQAARRAYPPGLQHQFPDTVSYKLLRPLPSSNAGGDSILGALTVPKSVEEEMSIPALGATGALSGMDPRQLAQVLSTKLYLLRRSGSDEELRDRFGTDYFRISRFLRCLERAIGLALGLDFEMQLSDETVIPGQTVGVKLRFANGTDRELPVEFQTPAVFPSAGTASPAKLDLTNAEAGHSIAKDYEYQVPQTAAMTVPHSSHLYDSSFFPVGDGRARSDRPFGLPFPAAARVNVGIVNISLHATTTIDVVPSFELSLTPAAVLLKDFETVRTIDFTARVVNHTPGPFVGELWVVPLAVAKDDYEPIQVKFSKEDEEIDVPLKLQAPISKPPLATGILLEFRRPRPALATPLASATVAVRSAGLGVPDNLQVGYISGLGVHSRLAEALDQLGCKHEMLTIDNLRFADGSDLKRFDSIIVDRDAYHDLPGLIRLNNRLLDYARSGGNLVVMSQKASDWNSVQGLAPLPMTLSGQLKNLEMTAARIKNDTAIVLDQPNKVEPGELASWPVAGGVYVPETWDSQYQSLISCGSADPGPGLLLFAKTGEGTYLFVALDADEAIAALYPGAYRLISNLLSLPKYIRTNPATGNVVK